MEFSKITAIVRTTKLEEVEKRLQEIGVSGLSVSRVKGYGEYANFYSRDWMVTGSRSSAARPRWKESRRPSWTPRTQDLPETASWRFFR